MDRLRYITKYWRTLYVSPRGRYDFLVSICPVSLVSCRWLNSRGVEQWLQCRLPKSISSFGDTFDAPRPWTAIRLSGFWRRPCNGHWGLWFYGVFLDETDSERCTWHWCFYGDSSSKTEKLLFDPFRPWDRPKLSSVYLWGRGSPIPAIIVESPLHLRFRIKSGILHNNHKIRSDIVYQFPDHCL